MDLAIIDGIESIAGGEGPWVRGIRHVQPGVLIAGLNAVNTDAVATAVMGYDPRAPRGNSALPDLRQHAAAGRKTGRGLSRPEPNRSRRRTHRQSALIPMRKLERSRRCLFGLDWRLSALAQNPATMFPAVRGTQYMVGAGNNLEVAAGVRILEQGGNAVDAGVAAVLAAAVTEMDHFGLGGEMPLLIKMTGKPVSRRQRRGYRARAGHAEFFRSRKPEPWEERADAADPRQRHPRGHGARRLRRPDAGAREVRHHELRPGGRARARLYARVSRPPKSFRTTSATASTICKLWPVSLKFFEPNGHVPRPAKSSPNPRSRAPSSNLIAVEKKAHGKRAAKIEAVRNYFYRGPLAKHIGDFSEKNGGLLRYEDLAGFHAELDTPAPPPIAATPSTSPASGPRAR